MLKRILLASLMTLSANYLSAFTVTVQKSLALDVAHWKHSKAINYAADSAKIQEYLLQLIGINAATFDALTTEFSAEKFSQQEQQALRSFGDPKSTFKTAHAFLREYCLWYGVRAAQVDSTKELDEDGHRVSMENLKNILHTFLLNDHRLISSSKSEITYFRNLVIELAKYAPIKQALDNFMQTFK